jgi:tetratricopeptide (TPR) repeat protein
MNKLRYIIVLLVLATVGQANAQSAKKLTKTADDFFEDGKYNEAIEYYTNAINTDATYEDAFIGRAKTYEKIYKFNEALSDYTKLCVLDDGEEEYFFKKSNVEYLLKDYKSALKSATTAIELDKKHLGAYNIRINSLIEIGQIKEAKQMAINAIDVKKTFQTYYDLAKVNYIMGDYEDAIYNYENAIGKDSKNPSGYLGLAEAQFMIDKFDKCLITLNKVQELDDKNRDMLMLRAKAYAKKIEYQNAINTLSTLLTLHPNDPNLYEVYLQRGIYYYDFNQHINAINDFNQAIELKPQTTAAYFYRAISYEVIRDYDAAIADYEKLASFELETKEQEKQLAEAQKRLFELKRENNKPVLVFESPKIRKDGELEFLLNEKYGIITAKVKDESEIKSLKVNGNRVLFDENTKNNEFEVKIDLNSSEVVSFEVLDVYENMLSKTYKIVRIENNPPEVHLVRPFASDDGQIYLESDDPNIFVEGTISDESEIVSIAIDGIRASFNPENLNPTFTANIDLTNKREITVEVEDIYGNSKTQRFMINRQIANINDDNPMGKTWVVFIENSNYSTFASLSGPTKDVSMMKAALAKYQVHNIIHKKDMTKEEMEKFFSIELRDLVSKNRVNSILVWYAGHGKFINNTGYWIPVDANRDDEFTYFNIGNLKSAMQSYSDIITHTLVITDACESGPTFYQAMRSELKIRDCSDWNATKFKSSQVFSSAGYELASDNSQFTKTFSNSLVHNPNSCIPIESIVKSVTESVSKNNQQKPQFGKIDGLADENGTFFFIKR